MVRTASRPVRKDNSRKRPVYFQMGGLVVPKKRLFSGLARMGSRYDFKVGVGLHLGRTWVRGDEGFQASFAQAVWELRPEFGQNRGVYPQIRAPAACGLFASERCSA